MLELLHFLDMILKNTVLSACDTREILFYRHAFLSF